MLVLNAEIIAVGSELLLGQITNTNAQFLSKHLANIGINVFYHSVVGDNRSRLADQIEHAKRRSNIIIFTGGLGPTQDDLTKDTIANCVGRSLVMNEEALHKIEQFFKQRERVMTENNRKQALVINGATVLPNDHGMAPGMAFKEEGIYYMLLPGPPKEMGPMFTNYGLEFLLSKLGKATKISSRVLNFFDIGESQLETELIDLIDSQTNPTIAPLAKEGEVTIRLTVKHDNEEEGNKLLDGLEGKILARVGSFFYGYNETSLLNEATRQLTKHKVTIASAESFTGGRFSTELATQSGISTIFKGGVVCYNDEMKQSILKVDCQIIEKSGAVSSECAKAMAENVRKLFSAKIGISFTGVAGPSKLEDKDVGTVYMGISIEGEETIIYPLKLAGTRIQIQNRAVKHGLYSLMKLFKGGNK